MKLLALLVAAHGLVHLIGFAAAFGLAEFPQLTRPITRPMGALWLVAAVLFLATAAALFGLPRWWWAIGAVAVAVSTLAISGSWNDARFGAVANTAVLVAVVVGYFWSGPSSLLADYEHDVRERLATRSPEEPVDDEAVSRLPAPVRRYLQVTGAIGQPRVRNFRVRMHGRIRSGPQARWIPFTAEQYNFLGPPARLFYLAGSMFGIPVQGYHRFVRSEASMLVKAAAIVPVARSSGPEMTRAETVTMFNDMCVMAPATLIEPAVSWESAAQHSATARFTNDEHTIRAELRFNHAGELVDFWSDDRYEVGADGTPRKLRWSTPLTAYRSYGPARIAGGGEGRWHEPEGAYAYIELTIDDVQYNVGATRD